MTKEMTPKQLVALLRRQSKDMGRVAFKRAALITAQRTRTEVVKKSPADQGIYRNAWQVLETEKGAILQNTAPHAGIIERGARPHKVSFEGIRAIAEWAMRKGLAVDEREAYAMAEKVAWKLQNEGQKGKFIGLIASYNAGRWLSDEFVKQMEIAAKMTLA